MSYKPKLNIHKDKLKALYIDEGLNTRQIAKIMGVSMRTICRRLHEFEIPVNPKGEKPFLILQDADWMRQQYKTKSVTEIAKEVGCSSGVVTSWLNKHDIKIDRHKHRRGKKFSEESRQKLSKARKGKYTGKDNWNWKEDKTNPYQAERVSYKAKEWSKQVRKRDNNTCVKCGETKKLHAHHIKSFKEYPELRYDLDNGMTLCVSCHQKEHKRPFPKWLFEQEEISKSAAHS